MTTLQATQLITVPRRVTIRDVELDPEVYAGRLLVLAVRARTAIEGVPVAALVTLRTLAADLRRGSRSIPDTLALLENWGKLRFTGQPSAELWRLAAALASEPDAMPPYVSRPPNEPTRGEVETAERLAYGAR